MNHLQLDFFLSALSPSGFSSYFTQAIQKANAPNPVYLKAGPGCGKSTILKRLAETCVQKGAQTECIHCSGDPSSLDGVVCDACNLCVIDATEPHAIEPKYPVTVEQIISLYHTLDIDALQSASDEILPLFDQCHALTARASRYLAAAGSLLQDSARVALCFTDLAKARAFAHTLGKRYLPLGNEQGKERIRLLSAVTYEGITFFSDTITALADEVIVLHDAHGAASKVLLQTLRDEALAKHYDIITCYCSLCPFEKVEHLFIPSLRLAFVTSNAYHTIDVPNQRNIHCLRFCNKEGIAQRTQRLRFNRKAVQALLEQTAETLAQAKQSHDALETYYKNASDFSVHDSTYQALIADAFEA